MILYLQNEVHALSPIFPRQVIIDGSNDWVFGNFLSAPSSNLTTSQCNEKQSFFPSTPDIEEINYLSDGKTLNATFWLSSSFKEPSEQYDYSLNKTSQIQNTSNNTNLVAIDIKDLNNKTQNEYTNERILSLRELPLFKSNGLITTTKLSNNTAHQVFYSYTQANKDIEATKIWTVINNSKVYTITYLADKERYSSYLPAVRDIIKSFSISGDNTVDHSKRYQRYADRNLGVSMQYPNDWRIVVNNDTTKQLLLYPPFKEQLYMTGTTIVMAMDVSSGYDFRGEDYRATLDWDPEIRNWTRLIQESRASIGEDRALGSGEYIVLQEQDNYGSFFDKEKNYVRLFMDLSDINFPDQYSLVFFVTESFTNRNSTCNIDLFDMTDEVHIPPPDFSFVVSPSSVSLRPGEEATMELQIKNSNTKVNSTVELSTNVTGGIEVAFIPNKVSVPPSGLATSVVSIKSEDDAGSRPYTFPIDAKITFPSQLTNYLTNEKYNNTGGGSNN